MSQPGPSENSSETSTVVNSEESPRRRQSDNQCNGGTYARLSQPGRTSSVDPGAPLNANEEGGPRKTPVVVRRRKAPAAAPASASPRNGGPDPIATAPINRSASAVMSPLNNGASAVNASINKGVSAGIPDESWWNQPAPVAVMPSPPDVKIEPLPLAPKKSWLVSAASGPLEPIVKPPARDAITQTVEALAPAPSVPVLPRSSSKRHAAATKLAAAQKGKRTRRKLREKTAPQTGKEKDEEALEFFAKAFEVENGRWAHRAIPSQGSERSRHGHVHVPLLKSRVPPLSGAPKPARTGRRCARPEAGYWALRLRETPVKAPLLWRRTRARKAVCCRETH